MTGAFIQGFLMNAAVFSSLAMMSGGMIMPGAAMPTLEGITCCSAAVAALVLAPTTCPSSVSMLMPFFTSCVGTIHTSSCVVSNHLKHEHHGVVRTCCLMRGMFTQFAAATAKSGTKRPTIPEDRAGLELMALLNPSAVSTPAAVAASEADPSCSLVTPTDALRFE